MTPQGIGGSFFGKHFFKHGKKLKGKAKPCCQFVVKTPNERKIELFQANQRHEKSPISRAFWMVRVVITDSAVSDHVPKDLNSA
jgi:hypothetical protein